MKTKKLTHDDIPAALFNLYWSDTDAIVERDGDYWIIDVKRHKRAYIFQGGRWKATTIRKGAKR